MANNAGLCSKAEDIHQAWSCGSVGSHTVALPLPLTSKKVAYKVAKKLQVASFIDFASNNCKLEVRPIFIFFVGCVNDEKLWPIKPLSMQLQ